MTESENNALLRARKYGSFEKLDPSLGCHHPYDRLRRGYQQRVADDLPGRETTPPKRPHLSSDDDDDDGGGGDEGDDGARDDPDPQNQSGNTGLRRSNTGWYLRLVGSNVVSSDILSAPPFFLDH